MEFKIFQLKHKYLLDFGFRNLPNGINTVDLNKYSCVYTGKIINGQDKGVSSVLENIFEIFNTDPPEDFNLKRKENFYMSEYFEQVKPTYIENWPAGLINHSVATVHFPLTVAEVDALIAHNIMSLENGETPTAEQGQILCGLEEKIDGLIKHFPRGAFVRLGSRSPKDSYEAYLKKFCYKTGKEAITALCDSERVDEDLWLAKGNNYTPHVAVREWIAIQPWQEFRCFIRNRELVGISQYNYLHREVFPEIQKYASSIEFALEMETKIIAPLLPADDVVVDFVYKVRQHGNVTVSEVVLLEVNPYSPYTDPCLFNWSKDKFENFEFRFNK